MKYFGYSKASQSASSGDLSKKSSLAVAVDDDVEFRTPRRIVLLRIAVFGSIYIVAAVLGALTFYTSRAAEFNVFETEYESTAALLITSIREGLENKVQAGADLASMYSYAFRDEPTLWPNVTYIGFEEICSNLIPLSQSRALSFNPIIFTSTVGEFNAFARNSVDELESEGYSPVGIDWPVTQGVFKRSNGVKVPATGNPNSVYPNVLVPVWQIAPMVGNMAAIMFDLHSETYRMRALDSLIQTKQPAMTDVLQLVQDTKKRPSTILFTPVFRQGNFSDTIPIGTTSVVFSWDDVISEILPDYIYGIFVVLRTPASTFTYTVNAGYAELSGVGDLHDTVLDKYKRTVEISVETVSDSAQASGSVTYSFSIYPSDQYEDAYVTDQPRNQALEVSLCIFATSVVFLIYDYLVSSREAVLTAAAKTASSVVNSLYPSFVRSRLLSHHSESVETPRKVASKSAALKLSRFVRLALSEREYTASNGCFPRHRSEDSNDYSLGKGEERSPPIAGSFDQVTVLFADLAGFTNWSSGRQPAEVFDLLENLYADFDASARSLGVFKVETIGDCYLAVTGIPDQSPDHALVMARFAFALHEGLERVKQKKSDLVGIEQLEVRIGFHCGPCTAGVLRGDKARFQLFGDTVNTASRMESTGSPGRIQISEQAFTCLMSMGPLHTSDFQLVQREEKVQAKGKGELTTYWLSHKITAVDEIKDSDLLVGTSNDIPDSAAISIINPAEIELATL